MNILYEQSLAFWNPDASANDSNQLKLRRIYASKSIMAWSELLKDAICAKLDINDREEKEKIFYREIIDSDFSKISTIVQRLVNWQMWTSPKASDIDTMIAGNKKVIKDWMRKNGLSVGFLVGAPE